MPQGTPTGIPAGTAGQSAGGILVPPDPAAFRRRRSAAPRHGGRFLGTPMGVLCEPPGTVPPIDGTVCGAGYCRHGMVPPGTVPPIGGTVSPGDGKARDGRARRGLAGTLGRPSKAVRQTPDGDGRANPPCLSGGPEARRPLPPDLGRPLPPGLGRRLPPAARRPLPPDVLGDWVRGGCRRGGRRGPGAGSAAGGTCGGDLGAGSGGQRGSAGQASGQRKDHLRNRNVAR